MDRVYKIQHCLGVRKEGRQFKSYRVKCPKTFDLHYRGDLSEGLYDLPGCSTLDSAHYQSDNY